MQIREQEEPGGEELGELGSEGATGGAGRSKYYIWIRSSKEVADCEQRPLEEVSGG